MTLSTAAILTGTGCVLLAGETLALYIGLYLRKKATDAFRTKRNSVYLFSDLFLAITLGALLLLPGSDRNAQAMLVSLGILIVTHSARLLEALPGRPAKDVPFCFNPGLFTVNAVKLILFTVAGILLLGKW